MEEKTIELVDFAPHLAGWGFMLLAITLGLFVYKIIAAIVLTLGLVAANLLIVIGSILFIVDPMYIRTRTQARIEWQWLGEEKTI